MGQGFESLQACHNKYNNLPLKAYVFRGFLFLELLFYLSISIDPYLKKLIIITLHGGNSGGSKMAKRFPTKYPGVYYIEGVSADGKPERIYYIKYRRGGKVTEEPVGRQFRDDMTPAKASLIRTRRIEGDELSNKEKRQTVTKSNITIDTIFLEYQSHSHHKPTTLDREQDRYNLRLRPRFGNKSPEEITQSDFNAIIKELKDAGKAPQTIKHVTGLLLRILKFASERGDCPAPQFKLSLPSINNEKTEDLTPDQIKSLLEAIDADKHPYAGKLRVFKFF